MEKITNSIASKIASELEFDENKREVVAYGTFAILHTIVSISLVAIFGAVFGVALEALTISFTTSVLRKYSGGVHASSPGRCAAIGTILCIGQALLIVLLAPRVNVVIAIILGIIVFVISIYLVLRLAPVDSTAKPIKREEKRKQMRRCSIYILVTYFVFAVTLIVLYHVTNNFRFITFTLCIYIGILWQVFTLTKIGHKAVNNLDRFFICIFSIIRR